MKKNQIKIIINSGILLPLLILLAVLMPSDVFGAETASQIANRASALLQRARGITVDFSLESAEQKSNGTLKSVGRKFSISTAGMSTWYDGKTMWTYNSRTQETTVTNPTPAEVAETNPLSLISANTNQYTAYFAKKQPAKGRRLVLMPKSKNSGIKSVAVTISDGSYMPTNIVVTPLSGAPITVHIKSINTKSNFSGTEFVYPSGKYPKVEIVDLR